MRLFDYLGTQCTSPPDGGIEVVHLEPQQDSMPTWCGVRIDKIRVMLFVPRMELKDQVTVTEHPIVGIPMLMLRECAGPQQMLVPAAAGPHITHGNQRLRPNRCISRRRLVHFLLLADGSLLRIAELQQLLAEVRAGEQPDDRLGRVLESLLQIALVLELSLGVPLRHLGDRLRIAREEMKYEEAFHPRLLHDQVEIILRPDRISLAKVGVLRNRSEQHDARSKGPPRER